MPVSQAFLLPQKINNIFLKFKHSSFKMLKIKEIGYIFFAKKRDSKV